MFSSRKIDPDIISSLFQMIYLTSTPQFGKVLTRFQLVFTDRQKRHGGVEVLNAVCGCEDRGKKSADEGNGGVRLIFFIK